jgi:hypothetical protein
LSEAKTNSRFAPHWLRLLSKYGVGIGLLGAFTLIFARAGCDKKAQHPDVKTAGDTEMARNSLGVVRDRRKVSGERSIVESEWVTSTDFPRCAGSTHHHAIDISPHSANTPDDRKLGHVIEPPRLTPYRTIGL